MFKKSTVLGLIAISAFSASQVNAGDITGPNHGSWTHVEAYDTDIYRITMRGGESARVAISGDGDTDLDLRVRDENGNVVCSSTSGGDDEYCRFTPSWTGPFTIEVANLGGVYNEYVIATN